jgi:hypothetical protein
MTAATTGRQNLAQSVKETRSAKHARRLAEQVAANKIADEQILQSGDDTIKKSTTWQEPLQTPVFVNTTDTCWPTR